MLQSISELDHRIEALERELADLTIEEPSEIDLKRLRKAFRERLGQFQGLMRSEPVIARQALRKLIADRIKFVPAEGRKYELRWEYTLKSLTDKGEIAVASPRGFEPRLPP